MITEIIIAEKLSKIKDLISNENIVNSGRVQGINIYKEKINILITKKHDEKDDDVIRLKKEIISKLPNPEKISIDVQEGNLKKSEITHLLNMSKIDNSNTKHNDKWNMDSHKLFWHLDRVEAWQKRRKGCSSSFGYGNF